MDRTRQRITGRAVELHGTIGPAATTMSGVAELAGVTRATLYRHFANEDALFTACSADWLAANPRPDLARWAAIEDPGLRLRSALDELYAWYRSTEAMRANVLRDIDSMPARIAAAIKAFPPAMRDVLEVGWPMAAGRPSRGARPCGRVRDLALADPRRPRRRPGGEPDGRLRHERDLRRR